MSNQPILANGPAVGPTLSTATHDVSHASGRRPVQSAIADAARRTSVDFEYLVAQAEVESSMNPNAKARTSSATGLYQFIESTWLGTMKRHGERFGLGDVAAQIGMSRGGSAYVADAGQRQAILALRNDPQIASLMAAGLAEDNRAHLTPIFGRQPDHGELYLAHFLGAGGAGRFLSELSQDPSQSADQLFRGPAKANRSIFYDGNGSARSLGEVMDVIDGKMRRALARADSSGSEMGMSSVAGLAAANGFAPQYSPSGAIAARNNAPSLNRLSAPQAPPIANPAARPVAMSNLLNATFGESGLQSVASAEGSAQIKRAYDRLKALGL